MWKLICVMLLLTSCCSAGPVAHQRKHVPIAAREDIAPVAVQQESDMDAESPAETETQAAPAPAMGTLTLPSNATSIRADITDNFSCANKSYGYYADVENDCQIFHVCLPVTYADGKENTFRWSFICPEETIFSQESFTCMRREDMGIECEDSYRYYELNGNFGLPAEEEKEKQPAAVESDQPDQEKEASAPAQQAAEPAEPAEPAPAPVPVPVKVQKPKPKPNRRKPAVTYNKPPRKAAVIATTAPVIEVVEEPEPEVVAIPSKPVKPQRFNARPNNKEKPQIIKPVVPATAAPVRNELFNAIRKRPAVFNKVSVSSTKKPVEESEPAVTEAVAQAELSEPQPTLKLQTMFVETAAPIAEKVEEPEAQASETAEISIAQPEAEPEVEAAVEEIKPQVDEVIPIEAIQEIPAVIVETLEEKPEEVQQMESKPAEMEVMPEPAIMESSSSDEESSNNIEALEAAKPADAPVSLPATPKMTEHSPLVEQMLDNDSSNNNGVQQSIGGFKPVDPVMAAEAEQLITDFLNTLRKHEEKTETEMKNQAMDMAETIVKDDSKTTAAETDDISIEEAKLPEPEVVDKDASVEEQLTEAEPQQKLKQEDSPIIKIMQVNHLPADYQIPVQVVAAPESVPEKETQSETEIKPVEEPVAHDDAQENLATASYMPPISIDDIVELVKERLDQNPKSEQMTPMELVLTPGAAAPMTLIQSTSETKQQQEVEPAPVEEQSEQQEQILPIYKRVSEVDPSAPEVREPKSHSRMDARKRRFLFRADAS